MSKHTSGPWTVAGIDLFTVKPEPSQIGMSRIKIATLDTKDHRVSPGDRRANGKLIAAAPEMLEALGVACEALALPTSEAGRAHALAIARAAIAKAEGA